MFKLGESEYCFCVSYMFLDEISNGSAAYNSCSGTMQHFLDRAGTAEQGEPGGGGACASPIFLKL